VTAGPLRTLYVFGAGGHGREVAWIARAVHPSVRIVHLVDDERYAGEPVNGAPVAHVSRVVSGDDAAFVTAVGDADLRRAAAATLIAAGLTPLALVHPSAEVTPTARIGAGAVIFPGAFLSDAVRVGAHAVVNVGGSLSHDVVVGDFATLSPGVRVAGNVSIGEGVFLGIGASVVNGRVGAPLTIGPGAVVGAGATVIADIAPGTVVGGVPARPLHRDDTR